MTEPVRKIMLNRTQSPKSFVWQSRCTWFILFVGGIGCMWYFSVTVRRFRKTPFFLFVWKMWNTGRPQTKSEESSIIPLWKGASCWRVHGGATDSCGGFIGSSSGVLSSGSGSHIVVGSCYSLCFCFVSMTCTVINWLNWLKKLNFEGELFSLATVTDSLQDCRWFKQECRIRQVVPAQRTTFPRIRPSTRTTDVSSETHPKRT